MSIAQRYRLLLFGSLYFAQGGALSYFLSFNVLYLRSLGVDADDVGLFQSVLVVPFVLKILLGAFSDRFGVMGLGHRHPYIVLGLLVQSLAFLLMPVFAEAEGSAMFLAVALVAATGMALYDTCTDGLAVESTPEHDRAQVQGVMVSARALGILCALLLGAYLVEHIDWQAVFVMVAAFALPGLLLTIALYKQTVSREIAPFSWLAFTAFRRPQVWLVAAIGVLFSLALDGILSFISYHPASPKSPDVSLLSWTLAISMLGRVVGASFSGVMTDSLGYRRSISWAISLSAMVCLALSVDAGYYVLMGVVFMLGVAYGYFTSVYAALAMALSDPRIAASMFAIFMMFLNIGIGIGQAVSGWITQVYGFQILAVAMAVLLVLNRWFAARINVEH